MIERDLTLDKIKAFVNDPYFTRDKIISVIKEETGIDLTSHITDPNMANDQFADLLYSIYVQLKEESDLLVKKFESADEVLKHIKGETSA